MPLRRRRLASVLLVTVTAALTGCGSNGDGPEVTRSYDVVLEVDDGQDRYSYVPIGDLPDFTVGDEVTFVMNNTGDLVHDLQILAPDGDVAGVAPAVNPGDSLELTVFLGQTGFYRLQCLVDDHLTLHSMQNLIEVGPADV